MAIKIVYYKQTIDNWGRQESSMQGPIIFSALVDTENWNDDMQFEDSDGNWYGIEELIGKEVILDDVGLFIIPKE
jgi:hypothetical protein